MVAKSSRDERGPGATSTGRAAAAATWTATATANRASEGASDG